jgi:carboxylate/amino acid/amine transporter
MIYLIVVSIIWGMSFGIIKYYLAGVQPNLIVFSRLFLSCLIFLPFFPRQKKITIKSFKVFIFLGSIQFGLMYIFYIYSFKYLNASQIALFTVFTPIYVAILASIFEKNFKAKYYIAAFLAVLGAFYIYYRDFYSSNFWAGFVLIQVSNLSFALGQISYVKYIKKTNLRDSEAVSIMYIGALLLSSIFFFSDFSQISSGKLTKINFAAIIYLGIIASGLCFFLWNKGARKVNPGILSIMNNMKIPLGVLFSLIIFGETIDVMKLTIGGLIIVLGLIVLYVKNN